MFKFPIAYCLLLLRSASWNKNLPKSWIVTVYDFVLDLLLAVVAKKFAIDAVAWGGNPAIVANRIMCYNT